MKRRLVGLLLLGLLAPLAALAKEPEPRRIGVWLTNSPSPLYYSRQRINEAVEELNQSDPEQIYLADAEAILRARLQDDPGDLNDLYSLALAQALQRHASDAAQTLTQIKSLDPSNPNALLGLGVVELYRFRPGQAQVALDQAAKMSPNDSTLRTLRIVASALRLDLPQTLHLLRS